MATLPSSGTGGDSNNTQAGGQPSLIGWIIFLMAVYLINKTKSGHTLIYWALVAIAIYLLVANYKRIMPILTTHGMADYPARTNPTTPPSPPVGGGGDTGGHGATR